MSNISDVDFSALTTTSENFIRLETLRAANDQVSNAAAELPIFRYYDIGELVHSSSDGQKFETRIHTINARHSSKYFGLKKGVVAYTLVANHLLINTRVIGAHEHESHYVYDLLANNTTEVQPTRHSTDTHGTNHVNFALLHIFGYQFAPRYKVYLIKFARLFMVSSIPASILPCFSNQFERSINNSSLMNGLICSGYFFRSH